MPLFQVLDNTLYSGQWDAGAVCKIVNRKDRLVEEGVYSLDGVLEAGNGRHILLHLLIEVKNSPRLFDVLLCLFYNGGEEKPNPSVSGILF